MGEDWMFPVLRPRSTYGVPGYHLCCGIALYLCHSYCLFKTASALCLLVPIPLWGVIPCFQWQVFVLPAAKLGLGKGNWRIIKVDPEVTRDSHRGFLKSTSFCDSKQAQSEWSCTTGRLPLTSWTHPKLFLRQLVHNGNFFHSPLCKRLQSSMLQECQCGNVYGKWNSVSYCNGGKRDTHSNLFFFILSCAFGSKLP